LYQVLFYVRIYIDKTNHLSYQIVVAAAKAQILAPCLLIENYLVGRYFPNGVFPITKYNKYLTDLVFDLLNIWPT
jgi:hypothetical protein